MNTYPKNKLDLMLGMRLGRVNQQNPPRTIQPNVAKARAHVDATYGVNSDSAWSLIRLQFIWQGVIPPGNPKFGDREQAKLNDDGLLDPSAAMVTGNGKRLFSPKGIDVIDDIASIL